MRLNGILERLKAYPLDPLRMVQDC